MGRIANRISRYFYGKKRFQTKFEKLQKISLLGQNYYNAVDLQYTGEAMLIENLLKTENNNQLVIFDVGAHHGQYSELFNPKNNSHEFHLFEPQKVCFDKIQTNYSSLSNVFSNHLAIGNHSKNKTTLYTSSKNNLIAMTVEFNLSDFNSNLVLDTQEEVEMSTIDQYAKSKDIHKIDFLKIDTEGTEYQCLEGAKNFLDNKAIRYIQFEYCFINMSMRNYFYDFWQLLSANYDIFRITVDGLYPINEYHINLEVMAPINYLAKLKEK